MPQRTSRFVEEGLVDHSLARQTSGSKQASGFMQRIRSVFSIGRSSNTETTTTTTTTAQKHTSLPLSLPSEQACRPSTSPAVAPRPSFDGIAPKMAFPFDTSNMPDRDEILKSYKELAASGVFQKQTHQSARFAKPRATASAPGSAPGSARIPSDSTTKTDLSDGFTIAGSGRSSATSYTTIRTTPASSLHSHRPTSSAAPAAPRSALMAHQEDYGTYEIQPASPAKSRGTKRYRGDAEDAVAATEIESSASQSLRRAAKKLRKTSISSKAVSNGPTTRSFSMGSAARSTDGESRTSSSQRRSQERPEQQPMSGMDQVDAIMGPRKRKILPSPTATTTVHQQRNASGLSQQQQHRRTSSSTATPLGARTSADDNRVAPAPVSPPLPKMPPRFATTARIASSSHKRSASGTVQVPPPIADENSDDFNFFYGVAL